MLHGFAQRASFVLVLGLCGIVSAQTWTHIQSSLTYRDLDMRSDHFVVSSVALKESRQSAATVATKQGALKWKYIPTNNLVDADDVTRNCVQHAVSSALTKLDANAALTKHCMNMRV